MICKNCGARVPESARSCPRCGRPAVRRANPSVAKSGKHIPPKKHNPKLGLALAIGTVVVLTVAICIAAFSGGSEEKPGYARVLDRYFAALTARDAEGYASTRPDAYIAYLTREDGAYLSRELYINELTHTIDTRMNGYAAVCGSKLGINYSVAQALDMSPHLARINEILARWYDFPADSVTSAVLVTGSYTVRGNSGSQQFEIAETLLLEIGGEWYFAPDIGQTWRN